MKKQSNQKNIKTGKIRGAVLATLVILVVAGLTIAMHGSMAGNSSITDVEIDSHFDLVDKNKDGNVTKEEFRQYLEARKVAAKQRRSDVRICPKTGAPCTGAGMCSSGDGEACGGGGCDKEGEGGCCKSSGAKTIQVKATNVTEVAEKKEGGCCGGKAKADGEKKEGGCCGGKAKADGEKKEGGCCGGKVKADGEKKEGGCCGGKAKADGAEKEVAEVKTAEKE